MLAHTSSTILFSSPSTAAIVDGVASQASCIALALALTSFNPSANAIPPATTIALNSPRL